MSVEHLMSNRSRRPDSDSFAMNFAARRCAQALEPHVGGPLWMIALWNKRVAAGEASSAEMLIPPADSPKTVTFSGSPPNSAMFSRTQSSAAI